MVLYSISEFSTDITMAEEDFTGTTYTSSNQELPPLKKTTAKQIHYLQKQIEDTMAKCRTLAFLTSDTDALEQALAHCEAAREKLATSATYTKDHGAPIYTIIEKAGVEKFRQTTKLLHRTGVKHKQRKTTKLRKKKFKSDPLVMATTRGTGRPKLKQSKRKPNFIPRQMLDSSKIKILKLLDYCRKVRLMTIFKQQ